MHFSASVVESPLQTDAETGGGTGQGPPGEGHLGGPRTAVLVQGGRAILALRTMGRADFLCSPCPFFCPWDFGTGSLSPCLHPQALGCVCVHGSASRQVCAHVCKGCRAAQGGGDGANSFLRLTRNRLMARSSDYSYLSLHDGNHILKLPGFFQNPGAGLDSPDRHGQIPALLSPPAGLRSCESAQTQGWTWGKRFEPPNAPNGKCLGAMPNPTCQTRWSPVQTSTTSPFPATALEQSARADSPAGILAANMPLKRLARDRCCQVKHGAKCSANGIKLRIPPVCGTRRGTTRSHLPPLPVSRRCPLSPLHLEIKVGKSKSFSPRSCCASQPLTLTPKWLTLALNGF